MSEISLLIKPSVLINELIKVEVTAFPTFMYTSREEGKVSTTLMHTSREKGKVSPTLMHTSREKGKVSRMKR